MCKLGTVGSLFQHLSPRPVWWMRVEIDSGSQLSSISAFWKVQTPQRLFWDFWPDKTITTSWSGSKVQVAPAGHLAITFKGYSRRQSKVLTAKSNAVPNQILCKATDLNGQPVKEKGIHSNSKEQHSYFRWLWAKIGNYVWYDSDSIAHQSLKSNWSQRKCYVWMPHSDLCWQDKLWFSSWRFF